MPGQQEETITLKRECDAVVVPQGTRVVVREGAVVTVTQALGGSYTVYLKGYLLRIDGADADALGKEITVPERPGLNASDEDVEEAVRERLKTCFDPEIPINIVDLGLIYDCRIEALANGTRAVSIDMTLTAPGCGMGEILVQEIRDKLRGIHGVTRVAVELVFDPPWSRERMSDEAKLRAGLI